MRGVLFTVLVVGSTLASADVYRFKKNHNTGDLWVNGLSPITAVPNAFITPDGRFFNVTEDFNPFPVSDATYGVDRGTIVELGGEFFFHNRTARAFRSSGGDWIDGDLFAGLGLDCAQDFPTSFCLPLTTSFGPGRIQALQYFHVDAGAVSQRAAIWDGNGYREMSAFEARYLQGLVTTDSWNAFTVFADKEIAFSKRLTSRMNSKRLLRVSSESGTENLELAVDENLTNVSRVIFSGEQAYLFALYFDEDVNTYYQKVFKIEDAFGDSPSLSLIVDIGDVGPFGSQVAASFGDQVLLEYPGALKRFDLATATMYDFIACDKNPTLFESSISGVSNTYDDSAWLNCGSSVVRVNPDLSYSRYTAPSEIVRGDVLSASQIDFALSLKDGSVWRYTDGNSVAARVRPHIAPSLLRNRLLWPEGELVCAYFYEDVREKTACLVTGKWIERSYEFKTVSQVWKGDGAWWILGRDEASEGVWRYEDDQWVLRGRWDSDLDPVFVDSADGSIVVDSGKESLSVFNGSAFVEAYSHKRPGSALRRVPAVTSDGRLADHCESNPDQLCYYERDGSSQATQLPMHDVISLRRGIVLADVEADRLLYARGSSSIDIVALHGELARPEMQTETNLYRSGGGDVLISKQSRQGSVRSNVLYAFDGHGLTSLGDSRMFMGTDGGTIAYEDRKLRSMYRWPDGNWYSDALLPGKSVRSAKSRAEVLYSRAEAMGEKLEVVASRRLGDRFLLAANYGLWECAVSPSRLVEEARFFERSQCDYLLDVTDISSMEVDGRLVYLQRRYDVLVWDLDAKVVIRRISGTNLSMHDGVLAWHEDGQMHLASGESLMLPAVSALRSSVAGILCAEDAGLLSYSRGAWVGLDGAPEECLAMVSYGAGLYVLGGGQVFDCSESCRPLASIGDGFLPSDRLGWMKIASEPAPVLQKGSLVLALVDGEFQDITPRTRLGSMSRQAAVEMHDGLMSLEDAGVLVLDTVPSEARIIRIQ